MSDRFDLEAIVKVECCAECGSTFLIAWVHPDWVLRCPAHGYSPPRKPRDLRGLKRLFTDGELHEAITLQILRQQ